MNLVQKRRYLLLFFLCMFQVLSICGQQMVPDFLRNYQWLEPMDVKDWEKQLELVEEADELIRQSNSKYIEVYNAEKNAEISEKKRAGVVKKLEAEAFKLAGESLSKYKTAYSNLYVLTVQYLEADKKSHPAAKEAISYKKESDLDFSNSGKAATLPEQKLLANGNEKLLLAVEKNIVAISTSSDSYMAIDEPESNNTIEKDFALDYEIYQKYLDYVNNEQIADPLTFNQLSSVHSEDMSYADFEALWSQYSSSGVVELGENAQVDEQGVRDSVENSLTEDNQHIAVVAEQDNANDKHGVGASDIVEDDIAKDERNADEPLHNADAGNEKAVVNTNNKTKASKESYAKQAVESNGFSMDDEAVEFRVQIAASKNQLGIIELKGIYKGALSIIEVKEGSYYKYQIRGHKGVSEAQKTCSNSGVDNAFIHAYRGSARLDLTSAVKGTKAQGTHEKTGQIDFVIQVAASRIRIGQARLKGIYNGAYPVSVVIEDGWYKYQIIVGGDLDKANEVLQSCGVKKAFMKAYMNGEIIERHKAIELYKNNN